MTKIKVLLGVVLAGALQAQAAADLQARIDAAEDGAVLEVAPGVYAPIVVSGKTLTLVASDGAVLDGGGTNRCAWLGAAGDTNVCATLRGFTLRNGYAGRDGADGWGGGAYGGVLIDCLVSNCTAAVAGGVYGAQLLRGTVTACTARESALAVADCVAVETRLVGNAQPVAYAAVGIQGGVIQGGTYVRCTVADNAVALPAATPAAGGLVAFATFRACTFRGNRVSGTDDHVGFLFAQSSVDDDCVFADNEPSPEAPNALYETTHAAAKPDEPDPVVDPDPITPDPDPTPDPRAETTATVGVAYSASLATLGVPESALAAAKAAKAVVLPQGLKLKDGAIVGTATETWTGSGQVAYVRLTGADKSVTYWPLDLAVVGADGTAGDDAAGATLDEASCDLWQGVSVEIAVTAPAGATVSASGLPTGVKLVKSKGLGTYSLSGVPTKAGTFVTVFTTKSGKTRTRTTACFEVAALPAWATGTFNGGGEGGQLTLTVAAKTAKASGTWLADGVKWKISSAAYAASQDGTNYAQTLTLKAGSAQKTLAANVTDDGISGVAEADEFAGRQNLWKSTWKGVAARCKGSPALELRPAAVCTAAGDKLTLTFKAAGAVAAKLQLTTPKKYSASCSCVLCPVTAPQASGFDAVVYVYYPPKSSASFPGWSACLPLTWTGTRFESR